MKSWLSGIRGAVLMVLTWTVGWGLGFGGLIEMFVDPSGEIVDIWFTAMAIPGFIGGVMLSLLFRIAEGRRRFDEVPLVHFTTWGALTGLVLGILAVSAGMARPLSLAAPTLIGVATALGVVAAIGSSVFFRIVARGPQQTTPDLQV